MMWLEFAASAIMGLVGSYFLYRGKKIQEPKMMLWGGVLIVLSYFLFSGGSKDGDKMSKAALNTVLPQMQGQLPQSTEQP